MSKLTTGINREQGEQLEKGISGKEALSVDEPKGNFQRIGIASTFDCSETVDTVKFWADILGVRVEVCVDEQNRVFQQLLDSKGVIKADNSLNVLMIRFEDWVHDYEQDSEGSLDEIILDNVENLITNLIDKKDKSASPYLLIICPCDPKGKVNIELERTMTDLIRSDLQLYDHVMVADRFDVDEFYPVRHFVDRNSDPLKPFLYKSDYSVALGSMIMRKMRAVYRRPYKLIVLDCDQTLWKGKCSESGPNGLQLTRSRLALQEFMLDLKERGLGLCLCSKNAKNDVMEVFSVRKDMPLKVSDFVSNRINWDPKSNNIKSISDELNIELESIIFLDDNPVECAEVRANCPEVLTIQLPESDDQISNLLKHIWAFDFVKTSMKLDDPETHSDSVLDEGFPSESDNGSSLVDFILSLQLEISIKQLRIKDLVKVAQLTHRASQFNFTGIKREAHQIQDALNSGLMSALTCHVKDKMGDYGLMGFALFGEDDERLLVDSFVINWRVMGRGVEHRLLQEIGKIALEKGLSEVMIYFKTTPQNQPARDFIESVAGEYRKTDENGFIYTLPSDFTANIRFRPTELESELHSGKDETRSTDVAGLRHIRIYNYIGNELNSVKKIRMEIDKWNAPEKDSEEPEAEFEELMTDLQSYVYSVWSTVLGMEEIGLDDNFFELGGTSLKSYQIITEIKKHFEVDFQSTLMDEFPTIRIFSNILETKLLKENSGSEEVDKGFRDMPSETDTDREVIFI
ncbi:HAD-IIIC family phosphatase [Balneola sp. MJW-20]|uniref:HAD-IIIC family phosphatase n=1 Tax=Gracilimonas aurantiaca TaxID=3234185 RepID=UPI003467D899